MLLPSSADESTKSPAALSIYPFRNGLPRGSVEDGTKLVKKLGYDGVGSIHGDFVKEYLKACDQTGLKFFSTYVGGKVTAEGFTYDPKVSEAIVLLKGRDALVELFVQGGKDATDEQAVAFVKEIAAQAEKSGLRVVLYPHSGFYIDTVDDALRIAKASECDNVGVIFNLCHFLKVEPGADLRATLDKAKPLLWSASTCGADTNGTNWNTLIRPLDEGSFDQTVLLRHLGEIGFKGPVGLQCYGIKIDPKENLQRSMKAWKTINQ
jgi:sugar phosphate isomerase/epimerase